MKMEQIPSLRFAFLEFFTEFNNPNDMFCSACNSRTQNGVYALDDEAPIYYSICSKCGWSLYAPAEDYIEHFHYYFPNVQGVNENGTDA